MKNIEFRNGVFWNIHLLWYIPFVILKLDNTLPHNVFHLCHIIMMSVFVCPPFNFPPAKFLLHVPSHAAQLLGVLVKLIAWLCCPQKWFFFLMPSLQYICILKIPRNHQMKQQKYTIKVYCYSHQRREILG